MRAHRGAIVSELSPEQYRDLQFTRDALEFGAVREIVTAMTPELLDKAEGHLARMIAAFEANDYRSYRHAQRDLHGVFLSAPGYPSLARVGLNLQDSMDRYAWAATVGRRDRWQADLDAQRQRIDLIRAGDADGLVTMLRRMHADGLEDLTHHLESGATTHDRH